MAKYRLSREFNNKIEEIDWSNLLDKEYQNITNDLLSIDRLTTRFKDSKELKDFLYSKGLLEDTEGKLCIIYKSKGLDKKLIYGISYAKDRRFLKASEIFSYVCERIVNCDANFLGRLINKYEKNIIHQNDMIILKNYIDSIENNKVTEIKKQYVQEKMRRFIWKEIYKYDYTNKAYVLNENGQVIENYRLLRELGRLCSNYYYQELEKEELKNAKIVEDNKYEVVTYEQVKKGQVPGQLRFL